MRFQFWSMSEDSKVGILLRGSSVRVCLVLYQGCCSSGQYNLPDRMLWLEVNTTLNQSYVLFITLVNSTYQSGYQYLPSIHSWDSSPWQVVLCVCFLTVCVINLTSLLFKSRFLYYYLFIYFLPFIHLFYFLIKQLVSNETVKVSRLFCLFILFLKLKL